MGGRPTPSSSTTQFPGEKFPVQGRGLGLHVPPVANQGHQPRSQKAQAGLTGGHLARTGLCRGGCVCTSHITSHTHTHTYHTRTHRSITHIIPHAYTFTCSSPHTHMLTHTHAHTHTQAVTPPPLGFHLKRQAHSCQVRQLKLRFQLSPSAPHATCPVPARPTCLAQVSLTWSVLDQGSPRRCEASV